MREGFRFLATRVEIITIINTYKSFFEKNTFAFHNCCAFFLKMRKTGVKFLGIWALKIKFYATRVLTGLPHWILENIVHFL